MELKGTIEKGPCDVHYHESRYQTGLSGVLVEKGGNEGALMLSVGRSLESDVPPAMRRLDVWLNKREAEQLANLLLTAARGLK